MKKFCLKSVKVCGFSLAEALITLLIVAIIAIASAPVITKRHKMRINIPHGSYACYWNGDNLVAKYVINGVVSDGKVVYDAEEGRYGCEFNPQPSSKNFVATIVGGGGGGSGAFMYNDNTYRAFTSDSGVSTSYVAEETAFYEFLVAGAGGGGGSVWDSGSCANAREGWPCAGSASPGAVVVSNPKMFAKGTVFSVRAGQGGAPGNQWASGQVGGDSYVKVNSTGDVLYAQGGGGGFSADLKASPNNKFYYSDYLGSPSGSGYSSVRYISTRNPYKTTAPDGNSAAMRANLQSGRPGGYYYKGFDLKKGKAETSVPDWYQFEMPGAYLLDDNWNVKTFIITNFFKCNGLSKTSTYAVQQQMNAGRPYRNAMMTKSLMEEFNIANAESQASPFASGSAGEVDDGACGATNESYYTVRGGKGVVAIKWKKFYGGIGGSAGKVTQIPYADMPQKTILFPGKGGAGGKSVIGGSTNVRFTAGDDGQKSYLKNGAKILGGTGAPEINPQKSETYSSKYDTELVPIGEDGALSDILTSKKTGTGGLGGFSGANTSIHGATQVMFLNGAEISGFNNIYGAGAGGGGGAVDASGASESGDLDLGRGGQGSSGLVFIQW